MIRCTALLKAKVSSPSSRNISPEKSDAGANRWIKIQDYGRTLSGMRATQPVEAPSATPGEGFSVFGISNVFVWHRRGGSGHDHFADLEFRAGSRTAVAVSFDDEPPQVITLVPANYKAQNGNRDWETSWRQCAHGSFHAHGSETRLSHVEILDGGSRRCRAENRRGLRRVKPSYLGPPESYHRLPAELPPQSL